jgi:hypothetical protein
MIPMYNVFMDDSVAWRNLLNHFVFDTKMEMVFRIVSIEST